MALTKDFKKTVMSRAQKDEKFRRALLIEAIATFLDGDLETGKAILRDYINATIGFEQLASHLGKDSKSLHRMLGPNGNPRASNLFLIFKVLQDEEPILLHLKIEKDRAA